jgi:hypothetical protein
MGSGRDKPTASIFQRLREEVSNAKITNSAREITVDVPSLEFDIPRVDEKSKLGDYNTQTRSEPRMRWLYPQESYLMYPSWLPNRGELWDIPGHPAKDFWAERFIEMPKLAPTNPDEKSQFELAMKPENFFRKQIIVSPPFNSSCSSKLQAKS